MPCYFYFPLLLYFPEITNVNYYHRVHIFQNSANVILFVFPTIQKNFVLYCIFCISLGYPIIQKLHKLLFHLTVLTNFSKR